VAWKLNKDFSSSELQEIFGNVWIQISPLDPQVDELDNLPNVPFLNVVMKVCVSFDFLSQIIVGYTSMTTLEKHPNAVEGQVIFSNEGF
jgi:hypothetical protein